MMGGNRFLRVRRVKPDRRQKNKGYQSLLANYYAELALPQLPRHDAPQKAKDRFYVAPSRLTLMTSQARSDSVREARSRRKAIPALSAARSKSWEEQAGVKPQPSRSVTQNSSRKGSVEWGCVLGAGLSALLDFFLPTTASPSPRRALSVAERRAARRDRRARSAGRCKRHTRARRRYPRRLSSRRACA